MASHANKRILYCLQITYYTYRSMQETPYNTFSSFPMFGLFELMRGTALRNICLACPSIPGEELPVSMDGSTHKDSWTLSSRSQMKSRFWNFRLLRKPRWNTWRERKGGGGGWLMLAYFPLHHCFYGNRWVLFFPLLAGSCRFCFIQEVVK